MNHFFSINFSGYWRREEQYLPLRDQRNIAPWKVFWEFTIPNSIGRCAFNSFMNGWCYSSSTARKYLNLGQCNQNYYIYWARNKTWITLMSLSGYDTCWFRTCMCLYGWRLFICWHRQRTSKFYFGKLTDLICLSKHCYFWPLFLLFSHTLLCFTTDSHSQQWFECIPLKCKEE